jgi:hypothetical protein
MSGRVGKEEVKEIPNPACGRTIQRAKSSKTGGLTKPENPCAEGDHGYIVGTKVQELFLLTSSKDKRVREACHSRANLDWTTACHHRFNLEILHQTSGEKRTRKIDNTLVDSQFNQ